MNQCKRRKRLNPKIQKKEVVSPGDVTIYGKDQTPVALKFRNGLKSFKFEEDPSKRQNSRRYYENGFIRKLYSYGKRTSDDAVLYIKDADRGEIRSYSTSKVPIFQIPEETEISDASSSIPSFQDLLQFSPSKSNVEGAVSTSANKKNSCQVCRICNVKHESKDDISTDSPWMGCVGGKGDCNYWIHSVCKGFADASQEDVEKMNFYCPQHNERAKKPKETSRLRKRKR